ncbi:MAG: HIRAN domain-containing protein [Pseudobdellovibrionaceae bacterium]|jgi:hypothetical protein|nr:HIRAN domain-containing protein [Pseudobdellovibrionaceae bacterium]
MKLYVGWQDTETRRWYTVGVLSEDKGSYVFAYTKGAILAKSAGRFVHLPRMTDFYKLYKSEELFPIFSNRVLPKSRPEYKNYLEWMGMEEQDVNPLTFLARSGGEKATDNLLVYPMPEKTADGKYKAYFFVHGLRYVPESTLELISSLQIGQRLFPMADLNNSADSLAIALRADDPAFLIGYCPRYIAKEIGELAKRPNCSLEITVNKVNKEAPFQMMLSCKAEAIWPEGFDVCDKEECCPLTSFV